jgi:hypothetical protein
MFKAVGKLGLKRSVSKKLDNAIEGMAENQKSESASGNAGH